MYEHLITLICNKNYSFLGMNPVVLELDFSLGNIFYHKLVQ